MGDGGRRGPRGSGQRPKHRGDRGGWKAAAGRPGVPTVGGGAGEAPAAGPDLVAAGGWAQEGALPRRGRRGGRRDKAAVLGAAPPARRRDKRPFSGSEEKAPLVCAGGTAARPRPRPRPAEQLQEGARPRAAGTSRARGAGDGVGSTRPGAGRRDARGRPSDAVGAACVAAAMSQPRAASAPPS